MKILKIALAAAAPLMLTSAYLPQNEVVNYMNTNCLQFVKTPLDNGDFRLAKQSYYKELFSKKELKKLAKAEKLREQASEGMVLAAAYQKQSDDLKNSSASDSKKIVKQISSLSAKAASEELKALKAFEKASDIYREVYTNELNNKTFSSSSENEISAQKLAKKAQNDYIDADNYKENITSENTLETYRAMYSKLYDAIHAQEVAFAVYKNSGGSVIDLSNYVDKNVLDSLSGKQKNVPVLVAAEKYDFDKDINLYKTRFHNFEAKLKISDTDKAAVLKLEADETNAATLMQKARVAGNSADTLRAYASEATTLAEKEYYEQKAQELELSECSNLVKAVKTEIEVNNAMYEMYKKYIPAIRQAGDSVGMEYETQAEVLFALSKTYEDMAASQLSKVEQYTQLSEGNEVKLQALENIENAVAKYLGEKTVESKQSLATGATDKHNDIAMNFSMDESDGAEPAVKKVADNNKTKTETKPQTENKTKSDTTPETNTKPKPVTTNNSTANKPSNKPSTNTTAGKQKTQVANSNAPVVSTWYYTRQDERMKAYKFPAGTVFSVKVGQYKEMPEPVEFPATDMFLAQNLKDQTFMRYYIGVFKTYDAAYATMLRAKDEGYKAATVAAFVNGKTSDVNQAKAKAEKAKDYAANRDKELKQISTYQNATTPVATNTSSNGAAIPLSELSSTVYAVQISSLPKLLDVSSFNVSELYYDRNDAGLYRYYTGVSPDLNIATTNLQTMKQSGYEDAYLIKVVDGKNAGSAAQKNNTAPAKNTAEQGTVYRVQIGAFTDNLSEDTKKRINSLKSKGYTVHTSQSGIYTVYTVGDCKTREQADKLKKQLVGQGFKDSYVATFVNGKKQN
ncbi:MAG: SPOR domain-containing protein [Bacteroidales bacterium]|nr:SPOR domain-containing protein [Bacteroidales bacterium]